MRATASAAKRSARIVGRGVERVAGNVAT